jgi:hypothetical protein
MQLLFAFDRVEKTLIDANSRFSTLMQTLASQLSCNSCSRLTGLRKLSLMQTLASQLSCNSCSRLTGLRKLSCKLSLLNSRQLSFSYDHGFSIVFTL